ncbi:MAG: prephenate dehydrogenase [Lachnospiraceae bacterium]|nr:prephenate dehydrogenase [Lachnospiraceae bacterium]
MWKLTKDKKILIVGLGLLGGSYAEALTDLGYHVGAVTRSESSIKYALDKGIIAEGTTEIDPEFIGKYDLLVFCLYPKVFLKWITDNQKYIKSGALITDVTGVKRNVVYPIQSILREDLEFIGSHPMAGREVYGVQNATKEIFKNANYIVTPTLKNTPEGIAACEELGRELGFRSVKTLSPEQHDEMIGFLSQLTHCIAVSLMVCKDSESLVDYTGDSFRDLTRIAKINESMWTELFYMNKDELLLQMELFEEKFNILKEAIRKEDTERIHEIMRLSTEKRKLFDKK